MFQGLPAPGALAPARGRQRTQFFSGREWGLISLVGAVACAVILGGYVFNLGDEADVPHARSLAMAAQVTTGAAITAALTRLRSRGAVLAVLLPLAAAFAAIQVAPAAALLHLSPLRAVDWALTLSGGAAIAADAARLRRLAPAGG